jgi:hypothetical protein
VRDNKRILLDYAAGELERLKEENSTLRDRVLEAQAAAMSYRISWSYCAFGELIEPSENELKLFPWLAKEVTSETK